ncbi:MAG: hypothetical protein ABSF71_37855 [Terriglobia bacterium]
MKKNQGLWMGARKRLSHSEAVEQYVVLRLRTEDINRLDFLLNGFNRQRITLPRESPFSAKDLKDTVRTAFFGWFASLTDRDGRAVYAFDCLFALFPERRPQIYKAQVSLEAVHEKLQQFRNNVAFHARSKVSAQIATRMNLRYEDTYLALVSAIHDFQDLMRGLRAEELTAIPELPKELEKLRVNLHPAFRVSDK